MSGSSASGSAMKQSIPSAAPDTRLHGRWLLLARAAWLALAALILVVFVASLPVFFTQFQTICRAAPCPAWQITPDYARAIQQLGFSLSSLVAIQVALAALLELVSFAVVAVIFWRRSDERIALVVALFLLTFASDLNFNLDALVALHPAWTLPVRVVSYVNGCSWYFVFALFPDGRFVPRWIRWFAFGFALLSVPLNFFPGSIPGVPHFGDLYQVYFAVQGIGLVGLQIYRYVRVSTQVQRQQTKWVVFGVAIAILATTAISLVDPAVVNQPHTIVDLLVGVVSFLLFLLIPLSFGIAILRYRLWDVDTLINKVLVYGLLTGLLGALYAGLIVGLGSLVGAITRTINQPLVLVISTLVIAALFLPVRRRIQSIIDRRFYRKKYDAVRTLAAFSATLRQEVDLNELREQLLVVVQETMQPAHVSLWLRSPEHEGKQRAP